MSRFLKNHLVALACMWESLFPINSPIFKCYVSIAISINTSAICVDLIKNQYLQLSQTLFKPENIEKQIKMARFILSTCCFCYGTFPWGLNSLVSFIYSLAIFVPS